MIKVDTKTLKENGITYIKTVEDAVFNMKEVVNYFKYCNRNLTEEQLRRILILINVLNNMEVR